MDNAILPGVRHPNLWPAIGLRARPLNVEPRVTARAVATVLAGAVRSDWPMVTESSSLGVYVFVKLDNGQEFEAHVIERTRRPK